MAQGCRLWQWRKSSAIWGTPAIVSTQTQRQSLTHMYGPAVRRKRFHRSGGFVVLHQCIRPLIGAVCAPGHHGYQRACVLITGQASNGPFGSPGFAGAGKTGPPFRFILSQTSAEKRGLRHRSLPDRFSSFVRAMRPFLCPGLQSLQGIARRDRQGWPSRLAFRKADRGVIAFVLAHSKLRPLLRTAQAMRASLLASAIANTL